MGQDSTSISDVSNLVFKEKKEAMVGLVGEVMFIFFIFACNVCASVTFNLRSINVKLR